MFLWGSRGASVSISMGYVPPALSREETNKLIKDSAMQDSVIEGHIRLALKIAGQYAMRNLALKDDLVGVGLEALVKYSERFFKSERQENYTGYISKCIHGACYKFLSNYALVRVPSRTYLTAKKNGKEITVPEIVNAEFCNAEFCNAESCNAESCNTILQDILSLCDEFEKTVILLLASGFTQKEIGRKVNVSQERVSQIRKKIWHRFKEN